MRYFQNGSAALPVTLPNYFNKPTLPFNQSVDATLKPSDIRLPGDICGQCSSRRQAALKTFLPLRVFIESIYEEFDGKAEGVTVGMKFVRCDPVWFDVVIVTKSPVRFLTLGPEFPN